MVCHPNVDTYIHHSQSKYTRCTNKKKKRQYATQVLEIEKGTFTPLVFTTTGGMREDCLRYHSRLAELLAMKKGEDYAKTMNWIRVKISFSLISSALVYLRAHLRGSRSIRRKPCNIIDVDIQTVEGVLEGRGFKHQCAGFLGQGFFFNSEA